MKPLFKAVIILIVATGVVVPAGYYSITVHSSENIALSELVPGNSTMVISSSVNGTSFYAYNSTNTSGIVLGVSMSGLSSQISSAENSTNATHNIIEPVLFAKYRGYDIYSLTNISLQGLVPSTVNSSLINGTSQGSNLSLNLTNYINNSTLYLADLPGIVSAGSFTAVQYSLNAYLDGTNFQEYANANFNSSANVSLYFTTTNTPIHKAVANIYYLKSTFNIEMNNQTDANLLSKGLGSLNAIANGFTVGYYLYSGNWVNGTITIGTGNYNLLLDTISSLPTGNTSQYFSGTAP